MTKHVLLIATEVTEVAIGDIPGFIAGVIEPYSRIDFSETQQNAILKRHQDTIQRVIMDGELIGRNPLTKKKEPSVTGKQAAGLVILIEELKEYLSKFGIIVKTRLLPQESGRYTLEEATKMISENIGENSRDILDLLVTAVQEGELLVYKPGSDVCYKPSTVRVFYEEAFWDDLNVWSDNFLPRIKWRYPNPDRNDLEQITLAAAVGAEPEYNEYLALGEVAPLTDFINYALGVPPEPEDRNASSDHREKDYALLLKRAKSAIHSGTLNAKKEDGEYWISKKAFRLWVEQQGFALNKRYEEAESLEDSPQPANKSNPRPLKINDQRAEKIGQIAKETFDDPLCIPYGGKAELYKLIRIQNSVLFTSESTFHSGWKMAKKLGLVQVEDVEQYTTAK